MGDKTMEIDRVLRAAIDAVDGGEPRAEEGFQRQVLHASSAK